MADEPLSRRIERPTDWSSERGGEGRAVHIDAVFPVLHGTSGEDGAVQGLLELSGIPYVGCDIQSSVICMDKSLAYVVAKHAGIATPAFLVLDGAAVPVPNELAYPVFVKPARSGSSFGVTRVEARSDIERRHRDCTGVRQQGPDRAGDRRHRSGLRRARRRCGPDRRRSGSDHAAARDLPHPPGGDAGAGLRERGRHRSRAPAAGAARTDPGHGEVHLPGTRLLRDWPEWTCSCASDGRIVLNEINTMPGFTTYSRYPRMMAAGGLGLPQLIDRLISSAMAR